MLIYEKYGGGRSSSGDQFCYWQFSLVMWTKVQVLDRLMTKSTLHAET